MKKVLLPACAVIAIFLSSCGGTPQVDDNSSVQTLPSVSDTTKTNVGSNGAPTLPTAAPLPGTGSNATAGLNPQHGQPGHRCDIAVGAPLNSPVQQAAPSGQAAPVLPNPSPNPAGSVTLNPAHGQPGHDCAIPVGQPLKS